MKLSVDLENIYTDNQWGDSVATVVRDEILNSVRSVVRNKVKEYKSQWVKEVEKVVKDTLGSISAETIQKIVKENLK